MHLHAQMTHCLLTHKPAATVLGCALEISHVTYMYVHVCSVRVYIHCGCGVCNAVPLHIHMYIA